MSVSPLEALHDRGFLGAWLAGALRLEYWHLLPLERQEEEDEREMEKPNETTGNCSLRRLSQRNENLGSHENLSVHSCFIYKHPEVGSSRWAPAGGRLNARCLTICNSEKEEPTDTRLG